MESGSIKLVYLYVCENELFEKIEINFTDDYVIKFEDETKSEISIEKKINSKKCVKEMYSQYIQSMSALVGINGTGKTTLLNCMGMQDIEPNIYYENITYFMLYEDDGRWYLEVKEGEQEFEFIEERDGRYTERHWQRVMYDEKKKKFIWCGDRAWDGIFADIREEYSKVKILYYRDKSAEQTGWTRTCGIEVEEVKDFYGPHSTVERINIKNEIHDIYYFMTHKSEIIQNVLKRRRDVGGELLLNTGEHFPIQWEVYDENDCGKTFIIQMLFNLCTKEHKGGEGEDFERVKKTFNRENDYELPRIQEYETLKRDLINIYSRNYPYNRDELCKLVEFLERIDKRYYQKRDKIYVRRGEIANEVLRFYLSDQYDPEFYKMLECMSKFNDELISYQLFSYQYDFMSAGEAKCIDIFSGVYQSVKKREEDLKDKSLILLLDEPDKGMHPELTRRFISILNDFSDELGRQNDCLFQYIISTHSPFLILDVPEKNIHRMKIKEGKTIIESGEKGIMSNVVDLIKDTFFLDSLFGVLSEQYFKMLQQKILELDGDVSEEEINSIRNEIEIINEPSLKDYLYAKLENKLEKVCSKENLITYYQRKIEELKQDD